MDTKESGRSVDSLRPEWWHEVKEVGSGEAEVLFRLGLPVWAWWKKSERGPFKESWRVWDGDWRQTGYVFYTAKGKTL